MKHAAVVEQNKKKAIEKKKTSNPFSFLVDIKDAEAFRNPLIRGYLEDNFEIGSNHNSLKAKGKVKRYFTKKNDQLLDTKFGKAIDNIEYETGVAINPNIDKYISKVKQEKIPSDQGKKHLDKVNALGNINFFDENAKKYSKEGYDALIKPMLKEFDSHMVKTREKNAAYFASLGLYGSTAHQEANAEEERKLRNEMAERAEGMLFKFGQQSGQMKMAERDDARNNIQIGREIEDRQIGLDREQDAILESLGNKIQSEKQRQIDALIKKGEDEDLHKERAYERLAELKGIELRPTPYSEADKQSPYEAMLTGQAGYAKGGVARRDDMKFTKAQLKKAAKKLESMGRGGDTILAHINPMEASLLKSMGGSGTINPGTGQPEYFWPMLLPLLGGLAGSFAAPSLLGGTALAGLLGGSLPFLGAGLGGALGGGLGAKLDGKKFSSGLLKGGLMGLTAPTMLGGLGSLASGAGATTLGSGLTALAGPANMMLPASAGSVASGLGGSQGAVNALGLVKAAPASASSFASNPLLQTLPSLLGAGSQVLNSVSNKKNMEETLNMSKQQIEDEKKMVREILKKRHLDEAERKKLEERERELEYALRTGEQELRQSERDRTSQMTFRKKGGAIKAQVRGFVKGGYIDGDDSGVADNIYVELPHGSYVLDATTVSALGDGNSKAGVKKIKDLLLHLKKGFAHEIDREEEDQSPGFDFFDLIEDNNKRMLLSDALSSSVRGGGIKVVPAMVSGGEYVISPEEVKLFSKTANANEGVKRLDLLRKKLKKHKGIESSDGLLPEAKQITAYMVG